MSEQEPITRIERALEQLGAEHEPPPGWEARVLAAVEPRPRRRWWWFAIPAFAVALAAVLLPPLWRSDGGALTIALDVVPGPRSRGDGPTRGGDPTHGQAAAVRHAAVNDRIHAGVHGGTGHRAIWVYRGETELIARCPGTGCSGGDRDVVVDVALDRIGTYRVVAIASDAALPVPTGAYDADLAAVIAAQATWKSEVVEAE